MESIVCGDRFVSSRTASSKPSHYHHYQQQQQPQHQHQAVVNEWVDAGPRCLGVVSIAAGRRRTAWSVL